MDAYVINLNKLKSATDLARRKLVVFVIPQLQEQGREHSDRLRYALELAIIEGRTRPAIDLDNYAKPVIDSVTQSRLLWKDDCQIDELVIRRRRDGNASDTSVVITLRCVIGQHRGLPSHFRARCRDAKRGIIDYSDVGYHLAQCLHGEVPDDLEEEEWWDRIETLFSMLGAEYDQDIWYWFRDHLPRFMALIPRRRMEQFLKGVRRACAEGEIVP